MTDRLIVRSISQAGDKYEPFINRTEHVMHEYAQHCRADYQLFVGLKDQDMLRDESVLHVSWNRIALILQAFDLGYRQVAWFDADTLVIDVSRDIFQAHDDGVPFHTVRVPRTLQGGGFVENDGVIVALNCPEARAAYELFWANRHLPIPGWQQGHYDAYVNDHPEVHAELDPRFNWFDWAGNIVRTINPDYPPKREAAVLAWHAWEGSNRFHEMDAGYDEFWLHPRTPTRKTY